MNYTVVILPYPEGLHNINVFFKFLLSYIQSLNSLKILFKIPFVEK